MRKLIIRIAILILVQFTSYYLFADLSFNPELLSGFTLPKHSITGLAAKDGFVKDCASDQNEYYEVGLRRRETELIKKFRTQTIDFQPKDFDINIFEEYNYPYFTWASQPPMNIFSRSVDETFHTGKYTQYRITEYKWILVGWFRTKSYYNKWYRK